MFNRLQVARRAYPTQFYIILAGLLVSTTGTSMIWPFLTIYVSETLELPLTEVTSLLALNGVVALFASFIAGPITDRFGRKGIMVLGLAGSGASYFLLSQASTLPAFAILLTLRGFFQPLYRVGTNAMVSDLVQPEKRPDAFALMRMSFNVGIAIGPAIGGFIAVTSYTVGFSIAAATLLLFSLAIAFFTRETIPSTDDPQPHQPRHLGAYGDVIRDRTFMYFILSFTLFKICSVMLWVLLGVYAKQNYGVLENQYGLISATNALMVVLFQVPVTKITKRYLPLPILATGALIYALGVGTIILGDGFWDFWLSYVVVTIGELIILPTANTFVANAAPVDQRGRYMSFFALAQGTGSSVAPLLGGILNDQIGPKAIWYGSSLIGILGSLGFTAMSRRESTRNPQNQPPSAKSIE
jgi:MFS family permease